LIRACPKKRDTNLYKAATRNLEFSSALDFGVRWFTIAWASGRP
jgi:hypothetical protein